MNITIRPPRPSDRAAWSGLWDQYLAFYETSRPGDIHDLAWSRILDDTVPMHCLLAELPGGQIVGLANFFFHPFFWQREDMCYLNDLYVLPDQRGQGIAEALIAGVKQAALNRGASELYWDTANDNKVARGLYDKIAEIPPFVKYAITLE